MGEKQFLCHFYGICYLLIALVTYGGSTPGNYYMHDVVRPNGAFWGVHGRCNVRPGILHLSVDLEQAFAFGRGVPPSSTCQFQLDEDKGSRRDFILACPIALAAASMCSVLPDRWFTPHFAVYAEFALSSWDAIVERARIHSPLWPACWLDCPDRSRSSQTLVVRDIWDVYIREVRFVPLEVRTNLFRLCNFSDVDSSWLLWSREAEASLSRAYLAAGGPPLSNPGSYVGRGSLSICTMRLGGRCHDRIHRNDRADEFDVAHSGFFLNSSLAPVLRFRRSFVSVCNVL